MKVGIIGYGAVGKYVAEWLYGRGQLAAIFDRDQKTVEKAKILKGVTITNNFEEFLLADTNLILETASIEAVKKYGMAVLESGKDLIVLSTGAFADHRFTEKIRRVAESAGRKIYVCSGAIAGIEAIKAIAEFADEVILTTRKKPEILGVDREGIIFEGDVRRAVERFPKNLNIAGTLALAVGHERVKVRVIAENVDANIHEITAHGKFGELRVLVKNKKMDCNPKTSFLAALSVIRILENLESNIVV
jgi:aspartate dehydrogenase